MRLLSCMLLPPVSFLLQHISFELGPQQFNSKRQKFHGRNDALMYKAADIGNAENTCTLAVHDSFSTDTKSLHAITMAWGRQSNRCALQNSGMIQTRIESHARVLPDDGMDCQTL